MVRPFRFSVYTRQELRQQARAAHLDPVEIRTLNLAVNASDVAGGAIAATLQPNRSVSDRIRHPHQLSSSAKNDVEE
jgi:hypothetical protein